VGAIFFGKFTISGQFLKLAGFTDFLPFMGRFFIALDKEG
jgi:hypothetical protein